MKRAHYWIFIPASIVMGVAVASPSRAQQAVSVDDFLVCKSIIDPGDRLRCVDRVFGRTGDVAQTSDNVANSATPTPGIILSDQGDVQTAQRDNVGDQKPEDNFGFAAERVVKNTRLDELSVAIDSISRTKSGKYVIILSNGQVWRQIRADTKRLLVKNDGEGAVANIKKRSLGSHTLSLEGSNRSIKVKRVK